jgi:hypothetical protein
MNESELGPIAEIVRSNASPLDLVDCAAERHGAPPPERWLPRRARLDEDAAAARAGGLTE